MRKIILAALAAAALLFSSCQTSVRINYLYPSDVNMSNYRHLAVMPVVQYRGYIPSTQWIAGLDVMAGSVHVRSSYSASIASDVSSYATDQLYSTLSNTGYFSLLDPQSTAWIVNSGYRVSERLRDMGYDAVMIPRIEDMTVEERIYTRRNSERVWDEYRKEYRTEYWYDYYVRQKASIRYSISIVDTHTDRVIAVRTFIDSDTRSEVFDPFWPRFDGVDLMFRRMIRGFNEGIRRSFVPTSRSYDVTLMDNKPELEAAKDAYKRASDGQYRASLDQFLSLWQGERHVPSGYNAALLTAALGDFDKAIAIAEEVVAYSGNRDARSLYDDLMTLRKRNDEALSQFSVSNETIEEPQDSGISIYDYLLR